ncbi:MAG: hypothetical protein AAF903_12425 [Pseudomonadota bacterium]
MVEVAPTPQTTIPLRSPKTVMRLSRMGSFFPTRLSFLRSLLRKLADDAVTLSWPVFHMNEHGHGDAVVTLELDGFPYSLIAFSDPLDAANRTDRVIATAWDACFVLFDGIPTANDIAHLRRHATRQEAGHYDERVLVLSRANRSVRLFEHVADALAAGHQPDEAMVQSVGYLMRTTAVYGNGKFGIADRHVIRDRPGLAHPFRIEMLTVYLIREFTLKLVDHVARARGGAKAITLSAAMKRRFGIGNSTGLGMAPFLVSHPVLIHNWMNARETALARVRAAHATTETIAHFRTLIDRSRTHLAGWNVDDETEQARIEKLRVDWALFCETVEEHLATTHPWDSMVVASSDHSEDVQELLVALVLEPQGAMIDDLCGQMEDRTNATLDPRMNVGRLIDLLKTHYDWALNADLSTTDARAMVWYVSEDKAEPRFGQRPENSADHQEMPHHIVHMVQDLAKALKDYAPNITLAEFMVAHPEHRHIIRRVQTIARHPYGEIRDNLVAANVRPIDLLRCKLSFFGASNFDPRSDRWTRITLFKGAPTADELTVENAGDVFLPA